MTARRHLAVAMILVIGDIVAVYGQRSPTLPPGMTQEQFDPMVDASRQESRPILDSWLCPTFPSPVCASFPFPWTIGGETMTEHAADETSQAKSKRRMFEIKVKRARAHVKVWLCPNGATPELTGAIDSRLAVDARRHGQDLDEELVEQALKQAERRDDLGARAAEHRHLSACAPKDRARPRDA
jgi:hypothetical protein